MLRIRGRIKESIERAMTVYNNFGVSGLFRALVEYHILRRTNAPIFILPNGLKVIYPERWRGAIGSTIDEVFIAKEYTRIRDFEPNGDDIVVDAGAFIGAYTLYASKKALKVLALEPSPFRVFLEYNVKLNRLSNVTVLPYALLDSNSPVKFHVDLMGPVGSSVFNEGEGNRVSILVPAITLDTLAERFGIKEINILKMDIEGSECKALKGAQKLLSDRRIDKIVMEVHPWLCSKRELISTLNAFKYKILYKLDLGSIAPTYIMYVRRTQ